MGIWPTKRSNLGFSERIELVKRGVKDLSVGLGMKRILRWQGELSDDYRFEDPNYVASHFDVVICDEAWDTSIYMSGNYAGSFFSVLRELKPDIQIAVVIPCSSLYTEAQVKSFIDRVVTNEHVATAVFLESMKDNSATLKNAYIDHAHSRGFAVLMESGITPLEVFGIDEDNNIAVPLHLGSKDAVVFYKPFFRYSQGTDKNVARSVEEVMDFIASVYFLGDISGYVVDFLGDTAFRTNCITTSYIGSAILGLNGYGCTTATALAGAEDEFGGSGAGYVYFDAPYAPDFLRYRGSEGLRVEVSNPGNVLTATLDVSIPLYDMPFSRYMLTWQMDSINSGIAFEPGSDSIHSCFILNATSGGVEEISLDNICKIVSPVGDLSLYPNLSGHKLNFGLSDGTGGGGGGSDAIVFKSEEFTATADQTIFNLTEGEYKPGANKVKVSLFGVKQPKAAYSETSSTRITLSSGVPAGTKVLIEWVATAQDLSIKTEAFISAGGQTLIELTQGSYVLDKNLINLYLNGIKQPKSAFVEDTETTLLLNGPLDSGVFIEVEWYSTATSPYVKSSTIGEIVSMTRAAYTALPSPSNNTLYCILD